MRICNENATKMQLYARRHGSGVRISGLRLTLEVDAGDCWSVNICGVQSASARLGIFLQSIKFWGIRAKTLQLGALGRQPMQRIQNINRVGNPCHVGTKWLIDSRNGIVFQGPFSLFILGYQLGTPVLSIVFRMVGVLICTKTGQVQALNQTGKSEVFCSGGALTLVHDLRVSRMLPSEK